MASSILPLPLSWLNVKDAKAQSSATDMALFGSQPAVGTKSALRIQMLGAGWTDVDAIDHVLKPTDSAFDAENFLVDLAAESNAAESKPEDMLSVFRKAGLEVKTAPAQHRAPRGSALWHAYTKQPWWLTGSVPGQRTLIFASAHAALSERATLAFMRDVWELLAAPPALRMPTFRRVSIDSFKTPEALAGLANSQSRQDVLIVHGGNHDSVQASLDAVSTLSAMRSYVRHGLLVYEMVVDDEARLDKALKLTRRQGFGTGSAVVFGFSNRRI